jgi:mono/diheme cytochrome c family protein/plastocyanin
MNTSKQVNAMIGLMFVFLMGTLLYFLWDSVRAEDAQEKQAVRMAEFGGELYALNCRSCHGLNGGGTLENASLPGAPMNIEGNRPDAPGSLLSLQNRFRDTIRCGRVGTLMPAWAEEQGGALNDFQIDQLVALITGAMPGLDAPDNPNGVSEKGWERAREEADHADFLEGKALAEAVGTDDTTFVVTEGVGFFVDSLLRLASEGEEYEIVKVVAAPASGSLGEKVDAGNTELPVERAGELFEEGDLVQVEDELMRVVGASDDTLTVERGVEGTSARPHDATRRVFEPGDEIEVERGAFSTEALEHEAGTALLAGPLEPPTGPLTGAEGTPPCGQLAAAPPAEPSEPIQIAGGETLDLGDNFFELDGQRAPTLAVPLGQEITLNLVNAGTAIHNMQIAGPDGQYASTFCQTGGDAPCSDPDKISAGAEGTITLSFDAAGTFNFRCDFHAAQMTGTIVVGE